MPLTESQAQVLRIIAANRSVNSHVAGGLALNSSPETTRFSKDIDLFHDVEEAVAQASEIDCETLAKEGFTIERQLWEPTYRRAWVARAGQGVKIEWAAACAKDTGWTPAFLLDQMRRNGRVERAALDEMSVRVDPVELKQRWLHLAEDAEISINMAAHNGVEIGLAFINKQGAIVWPATPDSLPHRATLGGVVPRLPGLRYELPDFQA